MLLRADASLVAVEDVKAGDMLLGPNGSQRRVLGTTRGVGPLFRVTQVTGMSYVVNDAHILVMERSASACRDYGTTSKAGNRQRVNGRYAGYDTGKGYSLITASDYAGKPERFKNQHYGFRRRIEGVHKALPVDPYLLGLWLGDGSSAAPAITNIDPEIIEFLRETAEARGWKLAVQGGSRRAAIYYLGSNFQRAGSFVQQLRAAGVFQNKHIPETYFGASVEQRRALLAGLVDTDGHVANGTIHIAQSRQHLLNDIIRLAHGLGLKASKRYRSVSCNGRMCDAWASCIGGDIDTLPMRIERKRVAAQVSKNKDWRRTRIDVEPIGVGEYFGFELDGDHLFMLADGTVTHNTRGFAKMSAVRAYQLSQAGQTGIILCGREFMNSLDDSSMAEIKAAIEDEPWLSPFFDIGEKYIRTKDGRIRYAFVGLHQNLNSIKSKARIHLAWVDEAEAVSDIAWEKLIPTVREDESELWVTYNPERDDSPTHKRFRETEADDVKRVEINWRDNPFWPAVLERERQRDLEERPEQYDHVWEGGFVTVVQGAYFAKELTKARAEGRIGLVSPDPLMTIRLVADIGGTGAKADSFVFWAVQFIGREIRWVDHYEVQGQPIGAHLDWLREREYIPSRAQIWLPHDGESNDKVHDVSYASAFRQAGYSVTVVPNQGRGAAKQRIEAMRRLFPSMTFDEKRCVGGLKALGWYHEKRDPERGIGLGPEHDWASHSSDAAGLGAIIYEPPQQARKIVYNNRGIL